MGNYEWQKTGRKTKLGEEIYQSVVTGKLAKEVDYRNLIPLEDGDEE